MSAVSQTARPDAICRWSNSRARVWARRRFGVTTAVPAECPRARCAKSARLCSTGSSAPTVMAPNLMESCPSSEPILTTKTQRHQGELTKFQGSHFVFLGVLVSWCLGALVVSFRFFSAFSGNLDNLSGKRDSAALQQLRLFLDVFPLVGVGGRVLLFGEYRPNLRQLGIDLGETTLVLRHVVLGEDRLDRALAHAQRAIDAF